MTVIFQIEATSNIPYRGYYETKKKWNSQSISFGLIIHLEINSTILRFAYQKVDVKRCMFLNFWDFCGSHHQVIAV